MSSRLEFSKKVRLEIFHRAGGLNDLRCEGCSLPLRGKPFEVDHTIEEWERVTSREDRAPLTAEDGKLLGYCCHRVKTAAKTAERAHGNRIIEKTARAKPKSRPLMGSRASGWKKPFFGPAHRREEA